MNISSFKCKVIGQKLLADRNLVMFLKKPYFTFKTKASHKYVAISVSKAFYILRLLFDINSINDTSKTAI